MRRAAINRAGQAMIESVVVILALSLVFFCAAQYSDVLRTKLLLGHAAARAARARAVGMNEYMAEKSARVALIPVSGKRLVPSGSDIGADAAPTYAERAGDAISAALRAPAGSAAEYAELWRVPAYLASRDESYARGILDYELWGRTRIEPGGGQSPRIRSRVSQLRPAFPGLSRLLGLEENRENRLDGAAEIENHAALYLESWSM